MQRKVASPSTVVSAKYHAERASLVQQIVAKERIAQLDDEAEARAVAVSTYRASSAYFHYQGDGSAGPGAEHMRLQSEANLARDEANRVRAADRDGRRRIAEIDALLGATATVTQCRAKVQDLMQKAAQVSARRTALVDLIATIDAEIQNAERAHEERSNAVADERVAAKIEGRAPKSIAAAASSTNVAQLREDRAAAQRQLAEVNERHNALRTEGDDVRTQLEHARVFAARLALEEWAALGAEVLIEAHATGADVRVPIDNVAVQRRRVELAEETRMIAVAIRGATVPVSDEAPRPAGAPAGATEAAA